jgi:hypothetical protein
MNRATWLQDRRMQRFRDVLSRWEAGELSMMEAGELLGMSERQFRRYRDRYEEDGLAGLVDQRLGKPSPNNDWDGRGSRHSQFGQRNGVASSQERGCQDCAAVPVSCRDDRYSRPDLDRVSSDLESAIWPLVR